MLADKTKLDWSEVTKQDFYCGDIIRWVDTNKVLENAPDGSYLVWSLVGDNGKILYKLELRHNKDHSESIPLKSPTLIIKNGKNVVSQSFREYYDGELKPYNKSAPAVVRPNAAFRAQPVQKQVVAAQPDPWAAVKALPFYHGNLTEADAHKKLKEVPERCVYLIRFSNTHKCPGLAYKKDSAFAFKSISSPTLIEVDNKNELTPQALINLRVKDEYFRKNAKPCNKPTPKNLVQVPVTPAIATPVRAVIPQPVQKQVVAAQPDPWAAVKALPFYHGNIKEEEAEKRLKEATDNSLYLIRCSETLNHFFFHYKNGKILSYIAIAKLAQIKIESNNTLAPESNILCMIGIDSFKTVAKPLNKPVEKAMENNPLYHGEITRDRAVTILHDKHYLIRRDPDTKSYFMLWKKSADEFEEKTLNLDDLQEVTRILIARKIQDVLKEWQFKPDPFHNPATLVIAPCVNSPVHTAAAPASGAANPAATAVQGDSAIQPTQRMQAS